VTPPETITNEHMRRIAGLVSGEPFVDEFDFTGCARYEDGCRCGRPVIERLVPIYGDAMGEFPVCEGHLAEHLAGHHFA
jgi:hypothetical protein